MSFKHWDENVAPHLGRIDTCLLQAFYYVDQAVRAMEALKERPNFTTKAEGTLELLEKRIKEARDEYLSKPVETTNEG